MLKKGLGHQAADFLREKILSGDIMPGQQITEESLAQQLGISRGTVRASVQQLVHEGLIRYEPYKGNYISPLSAQDAWEIYTLRNTLESMASRLAAEKITLTGKSHLNEALEILESAIQGKTQATIVDADFGLHMIVFELSTHKRLTTQYSRLETITRLYMNQLVGYQTDLLKLYQEHVDLVEAIVSGDADLAEKLAKIHNTVDGEFLISQLID